MRLIWSISVLTNLIAILCEVSSISGGDAVPVLLWSGSNVSERPSSINPLMKTSQEEFAKILATIVQDSHTPLYVFLKNTLCVEELTQHKEILQQVTEKSVLTYLPAVQEPLSVFKELPSYNETYQSNIDFIANGQVVIEPITDLDNIAESFKTVKETNPNIIGALTGRFCSYSRSERVRRAVDATNSTELNVKTNGVLLYSKEMPYIQFSKDKDFVQLPNVSEVSERSGRKNEIILALEFDDTDQSKHKVALEFSFVVPSPGYNQLKSVTYKENDTVVSVLMPHLDIVFPFKFSYHCSQDVIFSTNTTKVKLVAMQVQLNATSFGDAYDCVNFTTIPIWTGLFVTAILGAIMSWALTMIIDIRTMDRFDDPKGKTITISAQE